MKASRSVVLVISLLLSPLAGCATVTGPRQITANQGTSAESNWSRVAQLTPGTKIVLTTRGSESSPRHFVATGPSGVTVLNLTATTMPESVTRVLRDMASNHPEYFGALQEGRAFEQDRVRVSPRGVFLADRKVAGLDEVLEVVTRDDVMEIRGPVLARGSVRGAVSGGWAGFGIGILPGLAEAPGGLAWFVMACAVPAGAYLGYHWSRHATQGVVYRAP